MIGTKIGQYRVLQLLGEGGMGRVLLAEHVLMKTRHAIKMLHAQLSQNDMIVQRFINEARAAGAIGHRNVIEITHVDQVEGGGPWYLVMKYLEGQTLTGFLASRNAPIDQRLIVHIIGEALNGLQAAHDRQIIHRDLKPDNLYLTAVKGDPHRTIILDFGVRSWATTRASSPGPAR
jgi:serine/threonine-protein kinase